MTGMVAITKNAHEEIRVSRETFKGVDLLNIRVWYLSDEGEYCPSRKGIAVNVGQVPDLMQAIAAVMGGG